MKELNVRLTLKEELLGSQPTDKEVQCGKELQWHSKAESCSGAEQ